MEFEEIRALLAVLVARHAEVGCAMLGQTYSKEVTTWIDSGISICRECNRVAVSQIESLEKSEAALINLEKMDPFILEGAVDLDLIKANTAKLRDQVKRTLATWTQVEAGLSAIVGLNPMKLIPADQLHVSKRYNPEPEPGTAPKVIETVELKHVDDVKNLDSLPVTTVEEKKPEEKPAPKVNTKPTQPVNDTYSKLIGLPVAEKRKPGPKLSDRYGVNVSSVPDPKDVTPDQKRPLDWLAPMINPERYTINIYGSILDNRTGEYVKPVNGGHQCCLQYWDETGVFNIHELVWCAFHPEDREHIRTAGGVFRLNGKQYDNSLKNLVFKKSNVPFTYPASIMHPTEVLEKPAPKPVIVKEKPPISVREPDVEYRCIDWLPGIDPSHYSITKTGTVVDNRAGAKEVIPICVREKRCVKLRGKKGALSTHTIEDLMKRAFNIEKKEEPKETKETKETKNPEDRCAIVTTAKNETKIDIGVLLPELKIENILNDKTPEKEFPQVVKDITNLHKEPVVIDGYVKIDWYKDIPADKYMINADGNVVDTYTGMKVTKTKSRGISLTTKGSDRPYYQRVVQNSTLVWKAFHPLERNVRSLRFNFKDGDPDNCKLSNLERLN